MLLRGPPLSPGVVRGVGTTSRDPLPRAPLSVGASAAEWEILDGKRVDLLSGAPGPACRGINQVFRKTKRKTEGPQHFAFPEISRENRGCLVLHSGNSRVSLSLRAGLGQNLRQN